MMTLPRVTSPISNLMEIVNVSHTYTDSKNRQVGALQDISLTLQQGHVMSLVGMSGCGKSTLLRIIAGLIRPTQGEVLIQGISPMKYQQEQGISFVFQKSLLFPWRTVIQNVLLPLEVQSGRIQFSYRDHAYELIKMLGLTGFENSYPHQLSGGMLQRAAIARALVTKPRLLLLDEPFSALDEITRENLWIDFAQIWHSQGLSVVLVTHSIREAVFLADNICVLSSRPGQVKAEFEMDKFLPRDRTLLIQPWFTELCENIRSHLS
jgi:NitT/TauT family transport system ATP-binding protein